MEEEEEEGKRILYCHTALPGENSKPIKRRRTRVCAGLVDNMNAMPTKLNLPIWRKRWGGGGRGRL